MEKLLSSTTPIRVRYNECDSTGFAFNGNYFIWMQDGAGDLFEAGNVDIFKLAMNGQTFMAAHMECDFKRPAKYRDKIVIKAFVKDLGTSSLHIQYNVMKGETLLAIGRTIHVFVDTKHQTKMPIPDNLKKKLLYSSIA